MTREEWLQQIKTRLQAAYGDRLRGIILYGSEARGDAGPDSDIDILVLLTGPVQFLEDVKRGIGAVYAVVLDLGRPIHVRPVDVSRYGEVDVPLYDNVRREGIPL